MDAAVRPAPGPAAVVVSRPDGAETHPFAISGPAGSQPRPTELQVERGLGSNRPSSSSYTLPRLASVRVSNDGRPANSPEEPPRWGSQRVSAIGAADPVSRQSSGSSLDFNADALADQEAVVLTPSRLRLDSRVVLAHATLSWLTNAVWAVFIWQKLDGGLEGWSWWGVFAPTLAGHALHLPLNVTVLLAAHYMVFKQIGPPPPPAASPGLVLQYAILRHVRLRSHRVDWANSCLESAALLAVKIMFCHALESGSLADTSLRLMFTPIWAVWVASVVLLCFKDRTERMFGSSRDLLFIFLLFVAFKVDNQSTYSWRVVFLVPWIWFSGLLLVAAMVLMLLVFAKAWTRPRELLLPIGFVCLLLSTLPQFFSYIALVRRLDGDTGTSVASIMWPNALSWFAMWAASWLVAGALRGKERVRDQLLARGAVWTAHEAVARRLHAERDEAQRRVDELSEEQVAALVAAMMAGKAKPGRLRRVGATLYKRVVAPFDHHDHHHHHLADNNTHLGGGGGDRGAGQQQQLGRNNGGGAPAAAAAAPQRQGQGQGARGHAGRAGGATGAAGGGGGGGNGGDGGPVELLRSASAMAELGRGAGAGGERGGGLAGLGGLGGVGGSAGAAAAAEGGAGAVLVQPLGGGVGAAGAAGGGGLTALLMMKTNRVVPVGPAAAPRAAPGPAAAPGAAAGGGSRSGSGVELLRLQLGQGQLGQPLLAAAAADTRVGGSGQPGSDAGVESADGSFRIGTQVAPHDGDDPGAGPQLLSGPAAAAAAAPPASAGRLGPRPPLPPRAPAAAAAATAGAPGAASGPVSQRGGRRRPTSAPHPAAGRAAAASAAAGAAAGGGHGSALGRQVLVPGSAEWRAAVAAMQQQAAASAEAAGGAGQAGRTGGGSSSGTAAGAGLGVAAGAGGGAGDTSLLSRLGAAIGIGPTGAGAGGGGGAASPSAAERAAPMTVLTAHQPPPPPPPRHSATGSHGSATSPRPQHQSQPVGGRSPAVLELDGSGSGAPGGSAATGPTGAGVGGAQQVLSAAAAAAAAAAAEPPGAAAPAAAGGTAPRTVQGAEAGRALGADAGAGEGAGGGGGGGSTEAVDLGRGQPQLQERNLASDSGGDRATLDAAAAAGAAAAAAVGTAPPVAATSGAAGGNSAGRDGSDVEEEEEEAEEEEDCCVICYDGAPTCVFLECGHGGFCRRCAHLLFVRPPNECPTCRAVIEQVVEIEAAAPVGGEVAVVK